MGRGRIIVPRLPGCHLVLLLTLALLVGCGSHRLSLERALLHPAQGPVERDIDLHYVLRCPDHLFLDVPTRPEAAGEREIDPSGCITLLPGAVVEVAGLTLPEATRVISRRLGTEVRCRVIKYNSQHLFLIDPRGATQRSIPYRGPETVVEFLRRAGGLEGADLDEVTVVRAHVADGRPPEVFEVDLEAILLKKDAQTDIRLAPFDRVYLSQSRSWWLCNCLPPWMRPIVQRLTGTRKTSHFPLAESLTR
jgi:protein involved in polysaccharide export with SLBB domain